MSVNGQKDLRSCKMEVYSSLCVYGLAKQKIWLALFSLQETWFKTLRTFREGATKLTLSQV